MATTRRATKYRNVRTEYDGRLYDSKAEAARAADLDVLRRAGVVAWWLPQVRFTLGLPELVYRADFLVAVAAGEGVVSVHAEDIKGVRTAKFARDVRLWRKHGPMPLHIITKGKETEIITPER